MKAKDLFRDLGFEKLDQNDKALVYAYEDDYNEMFVYFDLMIEMYSVTWHRFIDNLYDYVPMAKRPKDLKHTCRYGHWQNETSIYIDAELHSAIHQQMIELGWIIDELGGVKNGKINKQRFSKSFGIKTRR